MDSAKEIMNEIFFEAAAFPIAATNCGRFSSAFRTKRARSSAFFTAGSGASSITSCKRATMALNVVGLGNSSSVIFATAIGCVTYGSPLSRTTHSWDSTAMSYARSRNSISHSRSIFSDISRYAASDIAYASSECSPVFSGSRRSRVCLKMPGMNPDLYVWERSERVWRRNFSFSHGVRTRAFEDVLGMSEPVPIRKNEIFATFVRRMFF